MFQKNIHTKGTFSAHRRSAARFILVALMAVIVKGPVEASTWKPTALVNTEAFQSIDDADSTANVVLKFGDTLSKTLTYNRTLTRFEFNDDLYVTGDIGASGIMSGAYVHAEKTLSSSGELIVKQRGTSMGSGALTVANTTRYGTGAYIGASGAVLVLDSTTETPGNMARSAHLLFGYKGNFDTNLYRPVTNTLRTDGTLGAATTLASSGTLVFEGAASGSSLYLGTSLAGAGLSSCSNTTNDKLLYNSATGRFSCGTDQTGGGGGFGTGNVLTIGNQKYVSNQGDTMTGALTIAIQGGVRGSIGLNAVNTISGAVIHAEKTLASSGTLVWEGVGSGQTLTISGTAAFNGGLTFGDAITDAITVNAGAWTFANDTNFALTGGVNGLSFDTSTLSVDATNDRIGIGTTAPDTTLDVVGTISGSQLRLSNMTTSGGVVWNSGSSLRTSAKGFSGQVLVSRATGTPEWKSPTGSMVWYLGGTIAIGGTQGPQVYMPFGFRPTSVHMIATGAPTGAAMIVDLKQNGVSIFGTKPQINAGSTTGGSSATITASIINEATVMTLDVTQVGSTFAGSGLTIMLNGSRRY